MMPFSVTPMTPTGRVTPVKASCAMAPPSSTTNDGPGWRGALRGLGHAHLGWMFRGVDQANPHRYAKDVLADPDLRFISRAFPLCVLAGLALPFGLGVALTGSLVGGLTGLATVGGYLNIQSNNKLTNLDGLPLVCQR